MAEVETYEEEVLPVESDATLAVAQPAELPEIKLFGRWSCDDVQVSDMSLQVGLIYIYIYIYIYNGILGYF
jgi:small subunit ribosomal protein S5e